MFALSTIILGVKSCKNGKEIESLEVDKNKLHEEVVVALNGLQEKADETNCYAIEASQVCGLREENQELRDSIDVNLPNCTSTSNQSSLETLY